MSDNHNVPGVQVAAPPGEKISRNHGVYHGSDGSGGVSALLFDHCPFSQRQVEMIQWLANGKTASEIGDILGLSLWTVQKYLDRAKQAAGVRKDTALVATALRHGWIA